MQSVLHLSIKQTHHHHHHHHYHTQQQQRHQHSHDHIIQAKEDKRMPCISGSYHTEPRIKNATRNSFIFIHQASTAHHYYRHHLDHHNLLQQKDDKRMVCIRWNIPWALARLYPKCRLATLSADGRRIRIKEDHQRWISTAT